MPPSVNMVIDSLHAKGFEGVRGRRLCARYDSCAGAGRLGYYNLCFPTAGKRNFLTAPWIRDWSTER